MSINGQDHDLVKHLEDVKQEVTDLKMTIQGSVSELSSTINDKMDEFSGAMNRLVGLFETMIKRGFVPVWSVVMLCIGFMLIIVTSVSLENKDFVMKVITKVFD